MTRFDFDYFTRCSLVWYQKHPRKFQVCSDTVSIQEEREMGEGILCKEQKRTSTYNVSKINASKINSESDSTLSILIREYNETWNKYLQKTK